MEKDGDRDEGRLVPLGGSVGDRADAVQELVFDHSSSLSSESIPAGWIMSVELAIDEERQHSQRALS